MTVNDRREYVRIAVDLPENPKLVDADPRAKWLYVVAICYAGRNLTDGHFPTRIVQQLSGNRTSYVRELDDRMVIHLTGHGCKDCTQPLPGWAVIHDYLEHQRSREEAEDSRSAKRRGAALTNHKRWHNEPDPACRYCDRSSDQYSESSSDRSSESLRGRSGVAEGESEVEVVGVTGSQSLPDRTRATIDRLDLNKIATRLHCDLAHARRVATDVLTRANGEVAHPMAYLMSAINDDPDRYQPASQPPRIADLCPEHQRDRATCPPTWHQDQP